MKAINSIFLVLFLAGGVASAATAQSFRTDINPALRYYQAFLAAPDISAPEFDYLATNCWSGQKLPPRFGELVSRYDSEFKLVRQAAAATVPCDWGIDMSDGPFTLLPQLARAKAVALGARFRVSWALQHDRQGDARDDFLASFALARNISRDGILITTLVQSAMEAILCGNLAENFGRFTSETLRQVADGLDHAPERRTVAAALTAERRLLHDRLVNKVMALQKENPGGDAKVMAGINKLFAPSENPESSQATLSQTDPALSERITQASGGTSEGVLKLLREQGQLYDRLAVIAALPYSEFQTAIKQLKTEIEGSPNPLQPQALGAIERARRREFKIQVWLAMVRAATEYRLHGEAALLAVNDPAATGPFAFRRFVFDGVDRGFELRSAYEGGGFPEILIFVEKTGPSFLVDGPHAGQARAK
ncbi:MAG: hypothetical protein ABSF95_09355 [Verrucomicrobiota bacterium]|jgi:hypothetical protein